MRVICLLDQGFKKKFYSMTDKTCWGKARLQPSFRALWMDSQSPSKNSPVQFE